MFKKNLFSVVVKIMIFAVVMGSIGMVVYGGPLDPVVTLGPSTGMVNEGQPIRLALTVAGGGPISSDFEVEVAVVGGPAKEGVDFKFDKDISKLVVPARTGRVAFNLIAQPDAKIEGTETVRLAIKKVSREGTGFSTDTIAISIKDVVPPSLPVLSLEAPALVNEGSFGTITARLTGGTLPNPLTVRFTKSGTATETIDYTLSDVAKIVIPANTATGTISLSALTDAIFPEDSETVTITIPDLVDGVTVDSNLLKKSKTISINNVVPLPTLTLSVKAQDNSIEEGDSFGATVQVGVSGGPFGYPVTIPIIKTGTASSADYTLDSFVIPAGMHSKSHQLVALTDALVEGNETVTLQMGPVAGATIDPNLRSLTILDKTLPVVVEPPQLVASPPVVFRGQTSIVRAVLPEGQEYAEDKDFNISVSSDAIEGEDYVITYINASETGFTMPAGESSIPLLAVNTLSKSGEADVVRIELQEEPTKSATVTMKDSLIEECRGEVAGNTMSNTENSQKDLMYTDFDSHEGARSPDPGVPHEVSLNIILPDTNGYAPGENQAACVMERGTDDTYNLKGYGWNTNLGFISFYCNGGDNRGIECGDWGYGVTVGAPESEGADEGKRYLTGYGWNPAFGYISFNHEPVGGGEKFYQVKATREGESSNWWNLTGYAWTQAGVYIKMDGTKVELLPPQGLCFEGMATGTGNDYPCCLDNAAEFESCQIPEIESCEVLEGESLICCEARATGATPLPLECMTTPPTQCEIDMAENGVLKNSECCVHIQYKDESICEKDPRCLPPFFKEEGICVLPQPDTRLVSPEDVPIADCIDGYDFNLYINDKDGKPVDHSDELIVLNFYWEDTVKMDQVSGGSILGTNSSKIKSPWDEGIGGVKYKPISIEISVDPETGVSNFDNYFEKVDNETGHYKLRHENGRGDYRIRSCAPTSGGNLSFLRMVQEWGTDAIFDNEVFVGLNDLLSWQGREPNNLKLQQITYAISGDQYTKSGTIQLGEQLSYFKFRPLVDVVDLYTDDLGDAITAYRDIPFNVNVGVEKMGDNIDEVNATVSLMVTYDEEGLPIDGCASAPFQFDIDLGASGYEGKSVCNDADLTTVGGCKLAKTIVVDEKDSQVLELTPMLVSGATTCPRMAAPAIYSIVEYEKDGKMVRYYSNKLPRLAGSFLDNLTAIIHGTIYSSMHFSPDSTDVVSSLGSTISNTVRDSIHKNINKYIKGSDEFKDVETTFASGDTNRCVVGNDFDISYSGAGVGNYATEILIGEEERASYFYGVDVVLGAMTEGVISTFEDFGKKVIVVEGGNVVINANVNKLNANDTQLVLVVLQAKNDSGEDVGGSVYIADDVTTLANIAIIADKGVHPFYKLGLAPASIFGLINSVTGEMKDSDSDSASTFDQLAAFYKGEHKDSYQLFIKGAVSARTVKGISNITKVEASEAPPKNLLGNNQTVSNDKYAVFRSMFFDWNAFRFYKGGDFDKCDGGLIYDWSCGACLTVGDSIVIANEGEIFGVLAAGHNCDTGGSFNDHCLCDGIDASVHSGERNFIGGQGDLIPNPEKKSDLARSDKPFYLYYVPVNSVILNVEGQ